MSFLRILVVFAALTSGAPPATAGGQPPSQSEFVPVDEIPPGEQIPAINLVAAAYGFVWVALLGYVWSIARRLQQVEAELLDLESRKR